MPAPRLLIRSEEAGDRAAVRRVNEAAFDSSAEADLVEALRGTAAWVPELSVVAVDGGEVVGHALLSVVGLEGGGPDLLSLGPMAVLPERQREGIGSALVVLGHPELYPRFGFQPARPLGIDTPYDAPDEAWLALPLPAWSAAVHGTVRYPPPWIAV